MLSFYTILPEPAMNGFHRTESRAASLQHTADFCVSYKALYP